MIQYFLAVILILPGYRASTDQQQYGPFHGLIACEKAAVQMRIATLEAHPGAAVGTACLSQKHAAFTFKEPQR